MKFSAQEEYGLRCLVTIAVGDPASGLTIPQISKLEGMTQPHVAKMLAILRKAGFIKSTRGQVGGYTLAKAIDQIVLGDVLEALGGKIFDGDFCERYAGIEDQCLHGADCHLRPLWARVQSAVDSVVFRLTLKDLIEGRFGGVENVVFHTTVPSEAR